jgi:tetratricopeptide (TPR) repeat protein
LGLLGKIFGGDFASKRAEADAHFDAARFGEAKLGYEAAIAKAREVPAAEVDGVRDRIALCKKRLAQQHLDAARRHADDGDRDAAFERLATAAELAPDDETREAVKAARDAIARAEAREEAAPDEVSEEEIYDVVAGTWEEEQLDEYEEYGDAIRPIVLALQEGKGEESLGAIETLLAVSPDACYLHFEHGRALLQAGRKQEGAVALRRFVSLLDADEGGRVRASAHDALARLAIEAGDDASAEAELRACLAALPEDVEPPVLLARFFRRRGRHDEALEFAEDAVEKMGTIRPHLGAMRELGLALAGKGDRDRAIEVLESAVEIYAGNDDFDFDPEFATTLARLHEENGDPAHAADFYRHLAAGSDHANHHAYNLEAGRLLAMAGKTVDARRYLARAVELAPDEAARAAAEAKLAELSA